MNFQFAVNSLIDQIHIIKKRNIKKKNIILKNETFIYIFLIASAAKTITNKSNSILNHQTSKIINNSKHQVLIFVSFENFSKKRFQHHINNLFYHTIEDIISTLSENKNCSTSRFRYCKKIIL